ncbi:efflux RND transporter permease subunit [Pedobacter helvus]|uniref:Efflux RND transporter permease subunit n=1 Tax=Pedobacter helvus TaxID=2563444 RepID=A0ABW9JMQ9_9SPHI|nr:efflux RND transporter permease subunit [Pedobacter ureilyticus]
MKKVLFEVLLVVVYSAIFFQFDQLRLPFVIVGVFMVLWIVPIQLLLSVSASNWMNEIIGRYHRLSVEERLAQIRSTFEGLSDVEAVKLRWFYIQACLFHYIMMLVAALGFVALALLFLAGTITVNELKTTTIGVLGAIISAVFGYFTLPKLYPPAVKKNLDETFHLFLSAEWKKKLFRDGHQITEQSVERTFYDFWLEGKTHEEKTLAFSEFIEQINAQSTNGLLLEWGDHEKLEIRCVIHARAVSKSLAGFLKYCIEERKVLSDEILHHRHRELIRDVFHLEDMKSLVFLEGQRYRNTPVEYVDLYRIK